MIEIFFPSNWDSVRCERELDESNFVIFRWGIGRFWDENGERLHVRAEAWPLLERTYKGIKL